MTRIPADQSAADIYKRLSKARLFIDDFFHKPLSLKQIAGNAFFSRFHFLRLFKESYSKTPHEYLTYKRLERAKYLLANSSVPVTEICMIIGFNSLGSFSELFRKQNGISPLHYRKQAKLRKEINESAPKAAVPFCFLHMNNISDK